MGGTAQTPQGGAVPPPPARMPDGGADALSLMRQVTPFLAAEQGDDDFRGDYMFEMVKLQLAFFKRGWPTFKLNSERFYILAADRLGAIEEALNAAGIAVRPIDPSIFLTPPPGDETKTDARRPGKTK